MEKSSPSLKIGDLVLLKEDNLPPPPPIRVTVMYPGQKNLVRTVAVWTRQTVHRLCLLPAQDQATFYYYILKGGRNIYSPCMIVCFKAKNVFCYYYQKKRM